jgi:hypothetical protein
MVLETVETLGPTAEGTEPQDARRTDAESSAARTDFFMEERENATPMIGRKPFE